MFNASLGEVAEMPATQFAREIELPRRIKFDVPSDDAERTKLRHIVANEAVFGLDSVRITSASGEVFVVPGDQPIEVLLRTSAEVAAELNQQGDDGDEPVLKLVTDA